MKADAVNIPRSNTPAVPQYEYTEPVFKFGLALALPTLMDALYNYFSTPVKTKAFLHCITTIYFAVDADTTLEKVSAVAAALQCFRSIGESWIEKDAKKSDLSPS